MGYFVAVRSPEQLDEPSDETGDARSDEAHDAPRAHKNRSAPRMATPARADRITVEGLLQWAQEGRIRLPSFQRSLRWEAEDKRALLDSMERGYPVGTLLLWKRPASTEEIGSPLPRAEARPTSGDVYLIVDGQQRVTTLWESLVLTPDRGERAMVFDLPSESFQVRLLKRGEREIPPSLVESDLPPALPLYMALDSTTLSEWVPAALPRETKRRYFEVGKRLREYPIPIYVVEGDDIEMLRVIFDRTNSTGRSLSRDEVFDALVGSRIVAGEQSGLDLVNEQLRGIGFGTLDRSTILKTFEAVSGERIGKADPRELDPRAAEKDLLRTARALSRAIELLRAIGVPHVTVLPYELPLVVLARLFGLHADPTERSITLLRRWFWRGAIAGRLGGASGSLQQHVDDIQEGDEHGSVQRLLERTGRPRQPDLQGIAHEELSIGTARGKLVICALLSHMPRSLVNGEKVVPGELFNDGLNDVLLRIAPPRAAPLGKSIANRLLHPVSGVAPLRLIRDCMDEGALASHAIDPSSQDALRAGDVSAFLVHRAGVLEAWITRFLDRQAEWTRDDTPAATMLAQRRIAS